VAEVGFRAENIRQERRRLVALVSAHLAGTPVYSDTLRLDDAAARAKFLAGVTERLNGAAEPPAALEARLTQLLSAATDALSATDDGARTSQADRLVQTAEAAELFHDPQDELYARVPFADHTECWPLRSLSFRRWLANSYYSRYEKTPGSAALADALTLLQGRAQFEGPCRPVYVRLAPDGLGGLYLDLADAAWRAVHVTARGWQVVAQPPVCFRRAAGTRPLPAPAPGGHLDELREFVNVASDDDWALLAAWLVTALRDTGPYPLLALYGPQGSAKTTTAKLLRALVDPAAPELRSNPKQRHDLAIAARNAWVVALDNVSHIEQWLSDALCGLATGDGWATRELYTDADEVLFAACRPALLNGITEYLTRGDLLDRALQLTLPSIEPPRRRTEKALWAAFEAARPRLLGALLDAVVGALRELPTVALAAHPRMADFAEWAVAAERGRGAAPRFLAAYGALQETSHQQALDGSAVGAPLLAVLAAETALGPWEGTAAELLRALNDQADDQTKRGKFWPKTARALSSELRRLEPALRGLGYTLSRPRLTGHDNRRVFTIARAGPDPGPPDAPPGGPAPRTPPAETAAGTSLASLAPLAAADLPRPAAETGASDPASGRGPAASDASDGARDASDGPGNIARAISGAGASEPAAASGASEGPAVVSGGGWGAAAYTRVAAAADLVAILPALRAAPVLALDTETTGLDPRRDRLRLIQLATVEQVYVVDAWQVDVRALAPLFAGDGPRLVGHNLKFDLHFLAAAGLPVPDGGRLFDTLLGAQLLGAGSDAGRLDRCSLQAVVGRLLGVELDKTAQRSDWAGPLTEAQRAYAARDAAILLPLAARLEAELAAARLDRVTALEMRALPAVVWLERTGAPFDGEAWARLSDAAVAEQLRLETELAALTGAKDLFGDSTGKWNSPAQMLQLLQQRGHPIANTDETTLVALATEDPLAKLLLAYREAGRKASAYGIEFLEHVHPTTGRIHPDYLPLGSRAGRMSCQRPNLQQVPRDPAYRACFRPPAGRVLVKADYSQIELRIAAELSGDAAMLAAYQRGEDLHTRTAAAVLGVAPAAVTKDQRQLAKALNFGLLYGMGAARLREHAATQYGVHLSEQDAAAFRGKFFAAYPGLRRWHQRQPAGTVETRTLAGRRRLAVERFTEKLNSPDQGTGADGLKAALARLWETRARCPSAAPVLVVHDEIVLECDAVQAEAARAWLVECMRAGMQPFLPRVPVEVEARIGADWSMRENV